MEEDMYEGIKQYLKEGIILENEDKRQYKEWARQFSLKGHHIYVAERRLILKYEKNWIISMFHDTPTAAHQNWSPMRKQIAQRYVWEGMGRDIKAYVKTCYKCQQRGGTKKNNAKRTITPEGLFERWNIDIVGPLPLSESGNRYIIVTVEYMTRWPEAKALPQVKATDVADFIYENIICRFGPPKIIQSDQGTPFVNEII